DLVGARLIEISILSLHDALPIFRLMASDGDPGNLNSKPKLPIWAISGVERNRHSDQWSSPVPAVHPFVMVGLGRRGSTFWVPNQFPPDSGNSSADWPT